MDEFCYCGQRISPGEKHCSFCDADLALVRRLRAEERGERSANQRYMAAFRRSYFQSWIYGLTLLGTVLAVVGVLFLFLLYLAY